MDAAQRYVQARAETEDVIKSYAPRVRQAQLLKSLLPAIGLKTRRADDESLPVGGSKFGGCPDVPSDFEWPFWEEYNGSYPLSFLCQINLADVAAYEIDNLLPKTGTLSFFLRNARVGMTRIHAKIKAVGASTILKSRSWSENPGHRN